MVAWIIIIINHGHHDVHSAQSVFHCTRCENTVRGNAVGLSRMKPIIVYSIAISGGPESRLQRLVLIIENHDLNETIDI